MISLKGNVKKSGAQDGVFNPSKRRMDSIAGFKQPNPTRLMLIIIFFITGFTPALCFGVGWLLK
jgi:hypothetical protein